MSNYFFYLLHSRALSRPAGKRVHSENIEERSPSTKSKAGKCRAPVVLLAVCALAVLPWGAWAQGVKTKAVSVPDTAKGFDKQYKEFVKAYWMAKKEDRKAVFQPFAIPAQWFTNTFGADEGVKVASEYVKQFEVFENSTAFGLAGSSPCAGCLYEIRTTLKESVQLQIASASMPPVQRFVIECVAVMRKGEMHSVQVSRTKFNKVCN